jgi:hypothetical protein
MGQSFARRERRTNKTGAGRKSSPALGWNMPDRIALG